MDIPQKFQFVTTEDGSPSLRFQDSAGEVFSESMHSLRGAFSETDYIYGTALRKTLEERLPPSVLSLGLGLGYNEVLTAAIFTAGGAVADAHIESFEIDVELREYFAAWISDQRELVPNQFTEVYDEILKRSAQTAGIAPEKVLETLKSWLHRGQLALRGPLHADTAIETSFSCFLFDAFSSKTTPELWQEDFLVTFFSRTCREGAVFSTYACTGALKRALRTCGFELQIREGFASKRDCTFAFKAPIQSPG